MGKLSSQSQSTPAKMFEIFGKNLDVPSDRFEVILDAVTINDNPENDYLVPIVKRVRAFLYNRGGLVPD